MLENSKAFTSFSSDDLEKAEQFYGATLGLTVKRQHMGILSVDLPGGGRVIIYPKQDHEPATFTVLNFSVDDIDAAVSMLKDKGIVLEQYDMGEFKPDESGIYRGRQRGHGPDIAWFKDPAGNILSVVSG